MSHYTENQPAFYDAVITIKLDRMFAENYSEAQGKMIDFTDEVKKYVEQELAITCKTDYELLEEK